MLFKSVQFLWSSFELPNESGGVRRSYRLVSLREAILRPEVLDLEEQSWISFSRRRDYYYDVMLILLLSEIVINLSILSDGVSNREVLLLEFRVQ